MPHVLIIEDDAHIRSALIRALGERGHAVSSAGTGSQGLQQIVSEQPDIVVLDLGLPDMDGRNVLAMIRGLGDVPVIVATARDADSDVVAALDAGADDYLVKPFSGAQLHARIGAVLRRSASAAAADLPLVVGGLRVDPAGREAVLDGNLLVLTPKEFDLLQYLAARPGQVVTKREISTEVWRLPYGGADKTVDVHLSWLRRKMGETAREPRYLHTVRGVGVKLTPP